MTAPPFAYFGGKTTLARRIVALLPSHSHYVEPFAGSLAVLLAKPPSAMETVNDIDGDLMAFWRVLRDQPTELARVCALTPHSRAEHQAAYDRAGCGDVERARRVWVCLTQGRGGTLLRTGWRHYVTAPDATGMPDYLRGYVQRIAEAAQRLQGVSLECRPAAEVIERYGAEPGVLLYVDPPYLGSTRGGPGDARGRTRRYVHELHGQAEHAELLERLCRCRAVVVLSGYPSPLYEDALAGWCRVEFPAGTGQFARGERSRRTEVIWCNRALEVQHALWEEAL